MGHTALSSLPSSTQTTGYVLTLGLLLLSLTTAGVALGGLAEAESQSSPVEISNWTDLRAIDDNSATLNDDYVLTNDLNKTTPGYTAVVNQTATQFTEFVTFSSQQAQVTLTRTPVAELVSTSADLQLTIVDPAQGTVKRNSTDSFVSASITYTTPTAQFVGFDPIGGTDSRPFTGSFDGQGHTIRDFRIHRPATTRVGLFGNSEGTLEQVTVANVTITGSNRVGALVGYNEGNVTNSATSGTVTGSDSVGALVGYNEGTVSSSKASGTVTGFADVGGLVGTSVSDTVTASFANTTVTADFRVGGLLGSKFDAGTVNASSASGTVTGDTGVGGLVGFNFDGPIGNSSASGTVTGADRVGGLVGVNKDIVNTSEASGTVTGDGIVGGLVGESDGTVRNSSASGAVNSSDSFAGGLVGGNTGTVHTSEASGPVNSSGNAVGGLVGFNQGTVSTSAARGAVNSSGFDLGGLVGANTGTVHTSEASGSVTGDTDVGGLIGESNGTVRNSSARGPVTGSEQVGGLVGSNRHMISNTSASGAVTGSDQVGGIAGRSVQGTIRESFATGAVTGSTDVGGLVGQLGYGLLDPGDEAILRDSYYDTQTTGQQVAVGTITEGDGTAERRGDVFGFFTSQLQGASAAESLDALDFTTTWQTLTDPPRYPELRALPSNPDPDPDPNLAFLAQAVTNQGTVLIQDVISDGPALVLVTYEADGDTVVAGVANGTFNGENVTVTLQADFGFPEDYTAHLVPASEVSQIYTPGETVSSTTTNAVLVNQTSRVTTVTNAPDVVVVNAPAKDTTGDGLLDDVRGDGRLDIFDVQTLFSSRNDPAVKDNAEFFDFQPGSTPVSIFDIQALFTLYIEN